MKKTKLQEATSLFAQRGGKATLKKYGPEHFSKISKKRWKKKPVKKVAKK
jgi:hypothetical protein